MQDIQGPDFPTYGIVAGRGGIVQAYKTGRGKIVLRARVQVEEQKRGKSNIIVTEIPYQVNKAELVKKIADLVREGRLDAISDIRDESGKDDPVRIVIELKSGEDPQVVVNQLYKHTNLQETFSIIMIALVNGRPETLNLKQLLEAYRDHRIDVIRRRTKFQLRKAEERKHIVEGLRIAVDHIDEVIRIIRAAATPEAASRTLEERFGLSAIQADHILRMQLRALTGLERQKLEQEYEELLARIADLRDILARRERVIEIIKADVRQMVERYGDERRTQISGEVVDIEDEALIPEQVMVVTVSHEGYIKSTPLSSYRAQGRGGKGVSGGQTKEGDFMSHLFVANTHDSLLFFTNLGRVYSLKVYEIPEGSRTARGRALINVIPLQENERVTSFIPVRTFDDRGLVMVTERGTIKKTPLSAFANILKKGIIAITLDEGDRLIDARLARADQEIVIGTRNGRAIRFQGADVRSMGRAARGVRGIRLRDDDRVVSMAISEEGATLLTVSEFGYGKKTEFSEYRETARGGIGVINMKTSERNGRVVGILAVRDEDQIILISQHGQVVRTRAADIRTIGRATQGVRVMGLDPGDRIVALSRLPKEEISDEEAKRALEEPAPLPPEAKALPSDGDGREAEDAGGDEEEE
jgi:DNA gyrase subunit A